MKEVNKKITLADGNELRLQISEAYYGKSIRLDKDYIENDKLINGFTLCQWDNYAFDVYIDDADFSKQSVKFIVDISDPLFFCFHRLLDGIEELAIDSDDYEKNKIMLFIRKKENFDIELEFRSTYPIEILEKYTVFVKNTGFDLKSKIDCYDLGTQKRLFDFFEDIKDTLLEEYHQISIDEYVLMRTLRKNNK